MKPATEAQKRLILELAEETQTTLYELPNTQHGASKKIEHLLRAKRNPRTNKWRKP